MNWQPIDTFPYPTEEWGNSSMSLFYSPEIGIELGYCVLTDKEEKSFLFLYDSQGLRMNPTHWMPLPEAPK